MNQEPAETYITAEQLEQLRQHKADLRTEQLSWNKALLMDTLEDMLSVSLLPDEVAEQLAHFASKFCSDTYPSEPQRKLAQALADAEAENGELDNVPDWQMQRG